MMLSDVSLSRTSGLSREQRPRKTKIGTEVAHVTRESDTTFKIKSQRSRSPGRFTHRGVKASGSSSGDRGNVLTVGTYCYVAVCRRGRIGVARRFGAHRWRSGAGTYSGGRPPTACYDYILIRHKVGIRRSLRNRATHVCSMQWCGRPSKTCPSPYVLPRRIGSLYVVDRV